MGDLEHGTAERTLWFVPALGLDFRLDDDRVRATRYLANVVGSETTDGRQMPILDLDCPHRYVPSSTAGHGHLFLDVPMTWRKYERILRALADAEIIGWPEYARALDRHGSFVNAPGVVKDPSRFQRMPTGRFFATFFRLWGRALWRELQREWVERTS